MKSLLVSVFLIGTSSVYGFVPVSKAGSHAVSMPKKSILAASEDIYIPPEISVEDEDGNEVELVRRSSKKRSATTVKKEVVDDPYSEGTTRQTPRRPKRIKRKKIAAADMAGTSWMDKNNKFTGVDESAVTKQEQPNDSLEPKKNFRENFRGTRVFVQGIPPGVSWKDLKDHFKIAGEVVFASVSVDMRTGQSKGHGIVQFETTEMAANAMEIMRNYPLLGSQLFVREDVQENKSGAQLRSKDPTPPNKWRCANEDNVAYMSHEELSSIERLIQDRDNARKRRQYEVSDRIRDELKDSYGVFVDDKLKMWWTTIEGKQVPKAIHDIKGDGRWKLKPWRQIPTTPENDACVSPEFVEGLLKKRDMARRDQDFKKADSLLEQARTSPDGDLNLRIHDESRTWRVWTAERPPQPTDNYVAKDPAAAREDAIRQCYEIVEEFAPDKVKEIEMVLSKFKGREFQVLKRLKNQYL